MLRVTPKAIQYLPGLSPAASARLARRLAEIRPKTPKSRVKMTTGAAAGPRPENPPGGG